MNRRTFIIGALACGVSLAAPVEYAEAMVKKSGVTRTEEEWRGLLGQERFAVLRKEGTERAFTSPLHEEKRKGVYRCAGCGQDLFTSEMKYDSGTGWPSFHSALPGALETKTDYKLIYPRTEYHCSNCGGHQGHLFNEASSPTGKRYCNNGLALIFVPL